jgi:hypothetical protein
LTDGISALVGAARNPPRANPAARNPRRAQTPPRATRRAQPRRAQPPPRATRRAQPRRAQPAARNLAARNPPRATSPRATRRAQPAARNLAARNPPRATRRAQPRRAQPAARPRLHTPARSGEKKSVKISWSLTGFQAAMPADSTRRCNVGDHSLLLTDCEFGNGSNEARSVWCVESAT